MLDIKYVLNNIDEVITKLNKRGNDYSHIKELVDLDSRKKTLICLSEDARSKRNIMSKEIGNILKVKGNADSLRNEVLLLAENVKVWEDEIKFLDEKINNIMDFIPNIPNDELVVGNNDYDNKTISTHLTTPKFDFTPLDHSELAEYLGVIDFERATKITGPRFSIYKGLGARLERALINFMIDLHSREHGYTEIIPPYIINAKSMYATGHFPKFLDDAFHLSKTEYYLNPTAEVPTINMYRDEIIDVSILPLSFVSFTTAFRQEAGSAGRDTKGILRQHQFNKVELIKITKPEESYNELNKMLNDAKKVLDLLKIPYRIVQLCTGDLGFSMAMTYDIEVWLPGQNCYREIASISNAEDFQARRASIRMKRSKDAKTELVHTLNGSGLAVGRTLIAIFENFQTKDKEIIVPQVLIPYMGVSKITK